MLQKDCSSAVSCEMTCIWTGLCDFAIAQLYTLRVAEAAQRMCIQWTTLFDAQTRRFVRSVPGRVTLIHGGSRVNKSLQSCLFSSERCRVHLKVV